MRPIGPIGLIGLMGSSSCFSLLRSALAIVLCSMTIRLFRPRDGSAPIHSAIN